MFPPPRLLRQSGSLAAICLLALVVLTGCKKPPQVFNTNLPTKEVMRLVIDPAATELWRDAGTIDTMEGTTYLEPTTDEGWTRAEAMSATIAEAANVLMLPERVQALNKKDDDWVRFAQNLSETALRSRDAAQAHNAKKLFTEGAALYQACVTCHSKYLIPFLKPGKGTNAPGTPGREAPA